MLNLSHSFIIHLIGNLLLGQLLSTRSMERFSIYFMGPLSSALQNKYLLTIVDEYSRFPFAFPCPSPSAPCVMKCLDQIFALCRTAEFIHSDRGPSFIYRELKSYLTERGVATSKYQFITSLGMVKLSIIMA